MIRTVFIAFLLVCTVQVKAQSLTPAVIGSAGSSGTVGSTSLSWTVGEVAVSSLAGSTHQLTQGFHQADPVRLRVNIKAFLQGPYNGASAMNDGLRSNGHLPLSEPYTALGYTFTGGGGESTTQPIIDFPGTNAIIDWVVLELRDKNDNTSVLHSRSALLQADGDVVDMDGFSAVLFPAPADDYYLAVSHRNHLAVMTMNSIALSGTAAAIDLTDGSTDTHGTDAQREVVGTYMLWAGDVTFDGIIRYTGQDNDRDPILSSIGGFVPTNTVTGYSGTDVNMDGTTKYTGLANDRDIILQNIGGVVPTNVRVEQVP
jgi:hypothetical protein